jgi:hypothetical protein
MTTQLIERLFQLGWAFSNGLIVDSLSESRLKSVRFLVGEIIVDVTSNVDRQIIKINH